MTIFDLFGILFWLFFVCVSFVGCLYFTAFHLHQKEQDYKFSTFSKGLIIVSQVFVLQLTILPIFEYLSENEFSFNFNFTYIWPTVIITGIILYFLNLFAHQYCIGTNKNIKKRILNALKMPLIIFTCLSLVVVIFHFSFGSFSWQIDLVSNPSSTITTSQSTQISLDDNTRKVTINTKAGFINEFIFFAMLCSSIVMGIYMGSSFAFFPLKLIKDFIYRPQKPDAETIVLARQCLMKESEELIEQGRDLYDKRRDLQMDKQDKSDKKKQIQKSIREDLLKLKRKKQEFRKSYEYYERLNNILDENPLIDLLKLILGCIFMLLSIIIVAENIMQFQKQYIVLSSIVDFMLSMNFLFFVIFHMLLYFFVIFSVYFSKYQIDLLFSSSIAKHDMRINETYTSTLLENNNTLILVSLGYLKSIYWSLPNQMGYTYGYLYFNDILSNLSYLDTFYKQRLYNILFLIAFSICTFLWFFVKTGKNILDQKVVILKKELQNQKQKIDQEEAKKKLLP